jgi:uncharacterized protein (DUF2235 family)
MSKQLPLPLENGSQKVYAPKGRPSSIGWAALPALCLPVRFILHGRCNASASTITTLSGGRGVSKNIVVCCDGTGNDFDDPTTDSNVVKLYSMLVINDAQAAYYHPGVGTMGSPNARGWLDSQWTRVKGLAFGAGLIDNVADGYRYLMNAYEPGDRIFIFGFSRGAYTARALAAVIYVFGLLHRSNEGLIPYVLRLYAKRTKAAKARQETIQAEENFKYSLSRAVDIHFCGVWDTVSSYGWINAPIALPFAGQNPAIRTGRHAVSIDERRCCYQDNLWGAALEGQDIRQVWFSGVHSDVGGSYPEPTAGWSKIALEWMMLQAEEAGLLIDAARAATILGNTKPVPEKFMPDFVPPDNAMPWHDSLHGGWWALEYFPRKRWTKHGARWSLPLGRWRRQIPSGSWIHESVVSGPRQRPLQDGCRVERWRHYKPQVTTAAAG